jgi:hypothetical protein
MRHLFRRRLAVIVALGALVMLLATGAQAATSFFNGFETDTTGWTTVSASTITRVASGDTSTTYASGALAATGGYYARLGKDTTPDSCVNGGGTQPIYYGPATHFGGNESVFPTGGYSTAVDIYLDVPYAQANPDTRFDWSSAIDKPDGTFQRDFVFNVNSDANGFVIAGSNNATRCGADPASGNAPVHVTQSGWYTFKHTFTGVAGGQLSVSLQLIDKSTNSTVGTWMLSDSADIIGTTVGGHRYGWFAQNEFNGLAIDNSTLSGLPPVCTPTGISVDNIPMTAAQIGGSVTGDLNATGCNIGVYYDSANPGSVGSGADIHGANYFGVYVNGAAVDVTDSHIHQIGDSPFSGNQHGRAVFYAAGATGMVTGNMITDYQKNGIVATGSRTNVQVLNNIVTGRGHIATIAQNGIVILSEATAVIKGNAVTANWYTPKDTVACGLLFIDASGVKQQANSLSDNEVNLCNVGRGGGNTSS